MNRKSIILVMITAVVFLITGIYSINAVDNIQYYDNMFESGKLTIYTDVGVNDFSTLWESLYQSLVNYGRTEYWNSQEDNSSLDLVPDTCDYSTMKCDIRLDRRKTENNHYSVEEVKKYENISINIVSNIKNKFEMVNNSDNVIINYDESMFTSESEKENYIYNYFNGLGTYNGNANEQVQYSYDSYNMTLKRIETKNSITTNVYIKKLNEILFQYTEEPYSDDFKTFTTGVLAIKTDSDITTNMISSALPYMVNGKSVRIDGSIVNDKVFIELKNYSTGESEKHLITLVKDENIDINIFKEVGFETAVNIRSNQPATGVSEYISNYFSRLNINIPVDDGYKTFKRVYDYSANEYAIIQYQRLNSQNEIIENQFHRVPINFVGYDNNVSDRYNRLVGNEVLINADDLSINTINMSLNYNPTALWCDEDYYCDLALYDYDTHQMEIHNVKVILNNVITNSFKRLFNLNDDDSFDIIMGNDIDLNNIGYIYQNHYDFNTNDSYNYDCGNFLYSNNKCTLRYSNYRNGISESHGITYNLIRSNPTQSYNSKVKRSLDVYPGETNDIWMKQYSFDVSKDNDPYGEIRVGQCDSETSKCPVSIINSNKNLEVHNTTINIKEGKSPEYNKVLPGDTLKLNSIYRDDQDYLRYASMGYLMSKTQTWSYLTDFNNGQAKAFYNDFESHTLNVEFAEANQDHKQIVDAAAQRIGNNFSVTLDDLDFINHFYYDTEYNYFKPNNYNSKTISDELNKIINNKHISYFFVVEGGGGSDFIQGNGGRVILYYDGIAYATTNTDITTNMHSVIYIPDETEDNVDAYVKAAQKRIDDYLGKKSGVSVSYKEPIDPDLNVNYIDLTNSDRNVYELEYLGRSTRFLIIKNSSKIKNATFYATDVNNNINISSSNANYPVDTIVSSKKIRDDNLMKLLGVDDAEIIDINLYSPTIGNIKNFNGVDFNVQLPIDGRLKGKKLYAYYIGDDGRVEEYPVSIDDFIGNFRTGHFSTYIISEKIENPDHLVEILNENNPKTADIVMRWVIIELISLFGLIYCVRCLYKRRKRLLVK